jgi:hypothetical protein
MRRTTLAIPLLVACTDSGDSAPFSCDAECADYYTIRAIDSVHSKVWGSVLSGQPPGKDGTLSFDHLEVPCIEGSLNVSGTAIPETSGSVTLDLDVVHQGCKQSDPTQADGYTITMTGPIDWAGSFSEGGGRTLSYQSTKLTVSGTVVETKDPTSVGETCTLQVTLESASNTEFEFAGAWCGRDIVVPGT